MLLWLPVAALSSVPHHPYQVKICKEDYVVWRNDDGWHVQEDVCMHRLAPLSQGRVNEEGCIECPYHGWAFDDGGNCARIPQLPEGEAVDQVKTLKTIKTEVLDDMLWGFFEDEHFEIHDSSVHPSKYFDELKNAKDRTMFVRELPYSFDILMENLMDPAHIPFAHHGLQATREDGCPIPMKLINNNYLGLSLNFEDQIRGKERKGQLSFTRPCAFNYKVDGQMMLVIFAVPVEEGLSRVFMVPPIPLKTHVLSHIFINKFLDTDIWLRDLEVTLRSTDYNETFKTTSDKGPLSFRGWFEKYDVATLFPGSSSKGVELTKLSRHELVDHWKYHTQHCKHCKDALKRSDTTLKASLTLVSLSFITSTMRAPACMAFGLSWLLHTTLKRNLDTPKKIDVPHRPID